MALAARGRRDGSFLSLDLFLFFVFFEIVLVPMYFLIGGWGYEGRVGAATKFFLYTMIGSAFMLVSIMATVFIASINGVGHMTFDLVEIAENATFAGRRPGAGCSSVRDRVRGQGADLPAAHVAARRAHPGAHRRVGRCSPA